MWRETEAPCCLGGQRQEAPSPKKRALEVPAGDRWMPLAQLTPPGPSDPTWAPLSPGQRPNPHNLPAL